jgi:hypothetical protein
MRGDRIAIFIVNCLVDTDFLKLLFALIKFWFLKTDDALHTLSVMYVCVCVCVFFFIYLIKHAPLRLRNTAC